MIDRETGEHVRNYNKGTWAVEQDKNMKLSEFAFKDKQDKIILLRESN